MAPAVSTRPRFEASLIKEPLVIKEPPARLNPSSLQLPG
jgi:hypothetical protein